MANLKHLELMLKDKLSLSEAREVERARQYEAENEEAYKQSLYQIGIRVI